MAEYVLGIDAGTESFRAGIFDAKGRCLGFGVSPNRLIHRHPGWAEQSPADWDVALVESIRKAIAAAGVKPSEIRGIGVGRHELHPGAAGRKWCAPARRHHVDGYPRGERGRGNCRLW